MSGTGRHPTGSKNLLPGRGTLHRFLRPLSMASEAQEMAARGRQLLAEAAIRNAAAQRLSEDLERNKGARTKIGVHEVAASDGQAALLPRKLHAKKQRAARKEAAKMFFSGEAGPSPHVPQFTPTLAAQKSSPVDLCVCVRGRASIGSVRSCGSGCDATGVPPPRGLRSHPTHTTIRLNGRTTILCFSSAPGADDEM